MKDLINASYKVLIGANISETVELDEAFASVQVIDPIDAANGLKKAGVRSARPSKKIDDEVEFDLKDKKKAVAWMLKHGFDKEDMEDVYPELFESNDLDEAKLEKPKGTPLEIQNQLGTMIVKAKTIKGISDDEYMSWYSNLDDKTYDRWEKMVKADPQYKKAYTLGTQGGSDKPPFPKGTFAAAIWSNEYAAGAMDS